MAKTKTAGTNESGKKEVRFRCAARAAKSVSVAGTFNEWNPTAMPMQSDDGAEWYVVLELPRGQHEYKYVVDGQWSCEPGVADSDYTGEDTVVNTFGTKNRIVEVQ